MEAEKRNKMAKDKTTETETHTSPQVALDQLAEAMIKAINVTKAPEKKNAITRKVNTPWTPKNGAVKVKLKGKFYQHGINIDEDMLTNTETELLNKLKAGVFLNGWVKVNKRRNDRGLDITYPVKTASQRLKLVNQFGIRNFSELIARCVEEAANPNAFLDDSE